MVTEINKSKTLRKHISCKCKCKFDSRKCNSNQKGNNDKCRCDCKNLKEYCVCKKDYSWSSATCSCKNTKYLASFTDDSVIMREKIINTTKAVITKTVLTESTSKKFYILLAVLLITIALLIAVSIYS